MKKINVIIYILFCSVLGRAQQGITPIVPFNEDTIDTQFPLFSWFVSDLGSNRGIYRFVLAEMSDGQNAEQAINSNTPHFKVENQQGNQLMYPLDAPELQYNKWYAWQVQRMEGNLLSDKSEAWKFILYKPEPKRVKYIQLNSNPEATIHLVKDGRLFFKLDEDYSSHLLQIKVLNAKRELVLSQAKDDTEGFANSGLVNAKKNGANLYELNVAGLAGDNVYTIEALSNKGKMYQLKFKIDSY